MKVYNIPATVSFVDALASGVFARYGHDPILLASVTILLPNRRATRALRDAFLRITGGKPILLPTIRPIGDVEEEALYLGASDPALAVPPAIDPLRRTLVLAQYLVSSQMHEFSVMQALSMAAQLGRFLDSVETEGLSLDALDTLVPDVYAGHWQINLNFLKDVLRVYWPQYLAAEGMIDVGARRRLLIEAYTKNLQEVPPQAPVIAAGSTGSIPATAALLKAVAGLPQGCVVLPGIDTNLEDTHWADSLEEGHPQAGLARLLLHFDITRAQVMPWDDLRSDTPRDVFSSTLMRPATDTAMAAWTDAPLPKEALTGITYLEAESLDEEATAIALLMRAHVEDDREAQPCVLVTPDRVLAGRVGFQLKRWGITIDDSAGIPLAHTPIGAWILLLCDVLDTGFEPVSFLSLLKSTFAAGGAAWPEAAGSFRTFVRRLDQYVMRGPRPSEGFDALIFRAQKYPDLVAGLTALRGLFQKTLDAENADARLRAVVHVAEELASTPDIHGSHRLWVGDAGEGMADCLAMLFTHADVMPALDWAGVSRVLDAAMEGVSIRPRFGTHPRLAILGPIEARLYQSATMILASLNEGTWPRVPEADGWMSRPMRARFGLPSPERGITLSSHDFCQGLGAKTVYLTRSKNRDGAPTTASRWLQRLDTLCAAQPEKPDLRAGAAQWLSYARGLDAPVENTQPHTRPAPNPPLAVRPKRMSVTEIAKWRRDPYYVYARHILRLRPLDPIAMEPDAAERGTLIHDALRVFGAAYPKDLPDDAFEKLIEIGRASFANARQHPDVTGHWWPRFVRMADAFVQHEYDWRQDTLQVYPEVAGRLPVPTTQGDFILEGRADRIERRTQGWAIIDYKSGTAPAAKAIKAGDEPQLSLLGHMLLAGCFNEALNVHASPDALEALSYWKTGGGEDVLHTATLKDAEALCISAKEGLETLVRTYSENLVAYPSWPDSENKLRDEYEYAHLARIAEWANADDMNAGEDAA